MYSIQQQVVHHCCFSFFLNDKKHFKSYLCISTNLDVNWEKIYAIRSIFE